MTRAVRAFRLALASLTIFPVPIRGDEATPARRADARFAYPVVGALIGLILAALSEALTANGTSSGLSAFLLVATLAILSGGLHLDDLAETADGLLLRGDPARRLAAMRDPHLSSFGVSTLILVLVGKFAAIEGLGGTSRALVLLAAPMVARSLVLVSAGLAPPARPDGTGRFLIQATTPRDAGWGGVLVLGVGSLACGGPGLMAALGSLSVAMILTRSARHKIGGVTGDTLGALIELAELTFLAVVGLAVAR
ncbi:adenosylcobinamide-GDP ribazoletransferase [Tundrisphaera lichenicola]|uniref:adenosylcobinamide-GDP ribazoletransferase n=1 Tax=Tundrisphaera lichenicola TaxID=2029860 RepID=UPI003EBC138B